MICYFVLPKRMKNFILFFGSLIFYAWGEPIYVLLMLFSTFVDYFNGRMIEKFRGKKAATGFLIASVIINLSVLCFFKYADFLVQTFRSVTGLSVPLMKLPLPIGISFYTFQTMSYTIDVYRGEAKVQKNLLDFGVFVTMFPQLIAGPIVKFELFKSTIKNKVSFVVRLEGNRHLLFKGKKRLVSDVASTRKGKLHTKLMYKGDNTDCYISYTTVQLPKMKDKDLNLVIIYRKDEENDPMYLLTDLPIKTKDDVEKIAKIYMLRWRIEEYFKSKKQNYDFENFRLRNLNAINNLNIILTCVMLHLGILTEKMNVKLLVIKIIEASESLKNKALVWYGQISKGIAKILEHANTGIKEWFEVEIRSKYKQLGLKI